MAEISRNTTAGYNASSNIKSIKSVGSSHNPSQQRDKIMKSNTFKNLHLQNNLVQFQNSRTHNMFNGKNQTTGYNNPSSVTNASENIKDNSKQIKGSSSYRHLYSDSYRGSAQQSVNTKRIQKKETVSTTINILKKQEESLIHHSLLQFDLKNPQKDHINKNRNAFSMANSPKVLDSKSMQPQMSINIEIKSQSSAERMN